MKYATFICLDYVGAHSTADKFSTVQHFASSEISSMTAPWLCHLKEEKITLALEILATFLAEEIYSTTRMKFSRPQVMQYIRRELCSELQTFHEFVRKKIADLNAQKDPNTKDNKHRIVKHKIEDNVVEYLYTLSQWFIYICDLSH